MSVIKRHKAGRNCRKQTKVLHWVTRSFTGDSKSRITGVSVNLSPASHTTRCRGECSIVKQLTFHCLLND